MKGTDKGGSDTI